MTATTNAENLRQYKIRFSLIVLQILAFASSPNMVIKVKNLSPNFKQIAHDDVYNIEYSHLDSYC